MNFNWNARLRSNAGLCYNGHTVKLNTKVCRIELSSKVNFYKFVNFVTYKITLETKLYNSLNIY